LLFSGELCIVNYSEGAENDEDCSKQAYFIFGNIAGGAEYSPASVQPNTP
jgi:hypothetical protein